MKECQKWWNEKQTNETIEEYFIRLGNPTTQEQVIDGLVELTWRAALECLQNQIDFGVTVAYSDADVLMAIKKYIKEELQDENETMPKM